MYACQDVQTASVFLVEDINEIPEKVRIISGMRGLRVMATTTCQGQHGVQMKYRSAIAQTVALFITDAFKREHKTMTKIIKWVLSQPSCKWVLVNTKEALERSRAAKQQRIALVCTDELRRNQWNRQRCQVLTKNTFMQRISVLDGNCSGPVQ